MDRRKSSADAYREVCMKAITHASCFSGIGAVDIAAYQLGIQNVFNCEINPFCRKILDYWFPESKGYEDVRTIVFKQYRGQITILSGGFPCQGFSLAGLRRGTEDARWLWPQLLRAIQEIQPAYVLGENVYGILSMVEPVSDVKVGSEADLFGEDNEVYEKRQRFVTEHICQDLEREGYSVQPFVIPACAVGAPHRRDRVWFVAKRITADTESDGGGGIARGEDEPPARQDTERYAKPIIDGEVQATVTSDTDSNRKCSSERNCGREGAQMDGGGEVKSFIKHQRHDDKRDATNADGARLQEERPELTAARTARDVPQRHAPNSTTQGLQRRSEGGWEESDEEERSDVRSVFGGLGGKQSSSYVYGWETRERLREAILGGHGGQNDEGLPAEAFRDFPTTQPIIRIGDDGLSSVLSHLSLPFPRWRAESVKALGNSMVVPLVKEILTCIIKDIENDINNA